MGSGSKYMERQREMSRADISDMKTRVGQKALDKYLGQEDKGCRISVTVTLGRQNSFV